MTDTATIERLAHEAGMLPARGSVLTCGNRDGITLDALARFAALVEAHALERAAKVCDENEDGWGYQCAAAIRAL